MKKSKLLRYSRKHLIINIIQKFLILLSISLLIILFGNPVFGTTDDRILSSFIDGTYTGSPEKISVFVQPFVSIILSSVQEFIPKFSIFSYFLLLSLLVSVSIHGAVTSTIHKSKTLELFWYLNCIAIVIWFVLRPTYTSAALLILIFNLLSILTLNSSSQIFNNIRFIFFFLSLLFVSGYFTRPESIIAVLFIFFPFIIFRFTKDLKNDANKIINYFICIITIFVAILINAVLHKTLSAESWSDYNSWNSMRHQIQHRLPQEQLLNLRSEINWSIPEYHLFMNLAYGDPIVFNQDWLRPAFKETQNERGLAPIFNVNFTTLKSKIFNLFSQFKFYFLICILNLFLLFSLFRLDLYDKIIIFFTIIVISLAIIYSLIALHTPERFIVPVLIVPIFLSISMLTIKKNNLRFNLQERNRFFWFTYFTFFVLLIPLWIYICFTKNKLNQIELNYAREVDRWLIEFDNNAIYLGGAGSETYHLQSPFKYRDFQKKPVYFSLGNWDTFSPHWFKRMNMLNLDSTSNSLNLFRENIYWLSNSEPDNSVHVEMFLQQKGFPYANRVLLKRHNSGLSIYQFLENNEDLK